MLKFLIVLKRILDSKNNKFHVKIYTFLQQLKIKRIIMFRFVVIIVYNSIHTSFLLMFAYAQPPTMFTYSDFGLLK